MTPYSLILLILLTILSGCARITLITSPNIIADIESAQTEKDFNRAWYYLNNIKKSNPQYDQAQSLKKTLTQQTATFESNQIKKARSLASAGRWPEAFEVLDIAQRQWRKSEELESAKQTLRKRETLLFNRLRTDLLVDEANWLASEQSTLKQMATLERDDALALNKTLTERKEALIKTLTELGKAFAKREDWVRTQDLLEAAKKLSGSKEIPESLAAARRHLSNQANLHRRAQEQKIQNQALALLDAYETSRSLADLLNAREYISSHNDRGQLDQHASRLEAVCQQRFQQGLHDGDTLYAQGRYQEALHTWANIEDIYPGDADLAQKLERAERVINNLKALSNEEKVE